MAWPEAILKSVPTWRGVKRPVIGMVHLRALPGAPGAADFKGVVSSAVQDAEALGRGGVDALMLENFGDVPFFRDTVPAETVSHITAAALRVRDAVDLPLGINVLRNDVMSGLAVASAVGAAFVRVNVLVGAYVTDQGVIEGRAAEVMRKRAALGLEHVAVFADVRVKHAAPLAARPIEVEAEELVERAGADAVIVSGEGTGKPTDVEQLAAVKRAVGSAAVLVGSGVSVDTVPQLAPHADGFIVGTAIKRDGKVDGPVDVSRVEALVAASREQA